MEDSPYMKKARATIDAARGRRLTIEERREQAIALAALMLNESRRIQTHQEMMRHEQVASMMKDVNGKNFSVSLTDQCFRSRHFNRVVDQVGYLLNRCGVPSFLSWDKRIGLLLFRYFGAMFPRISFSVLHRLIRKEMNHVILPGEWKKLKRHLREMQGQGVRLNLNHLGEAILGELEAERRLHIYLEDLKKPEVECVSIKVTTIYSQINLLAWEDAIEKVSEKLRQLYRVARDHHFMRPDGTKAPKLVNLDMEEYDDLSLTVAVFRKVLDESEFFDISAGIALQSYLPDSFLIQQELTLWAMQRRASGGAPIRIRLVKGANLAMEKIESAIHNWPQAPYVNKTDTDANFKRMLSYACQTEHAQAVHLGIGSHNLFDIAYAFLLRAEHRVEEEVGFEMLEGMAGPMRRVVQQLAGDLLLYCPVATEEEFHNAIAYLMRRLDENTAPENFLRHAFDMIPGTKEWRAQASQFSLSCHASNAVSFQSRRTQNRLTDTRALNPDAPFENEADTDWSLNHNRKWIEKILAHAKEKQLETIPLGIGGEIIRDTGKLGNREDPSNPSQLLYHYTLATGEIIDRALQCAKNAEKDWGKRSFQERSDLLAKTAQQFRLKRGKLIAAMVADGGKSVTEADPEVSEAIDFIEYYRRSESLLHDIEGIAWNPKGTILVAPPWNFPCAIPAGGIAAALAAGNTVLFKPAPEAVLTAWRLVQLFWEAGVSKEVLQFVLCDDDPEGSQMIRDERINAVVLTGATCTARHFLAMRPGLDLLAESGGKNAIIVTAMADRDLAVRDIVQSAFGHSGQKCSACSLAILEKEVYESASFKKQLVDAASSLSVGSPWDVKTKIGPLVRTADEKLLRGLTTLEDGEEWLLAPKQDAENPQLWSPGIKLGITEGSFTHQTELFGPVLGLMCADDLDHALHLANSTPYGLTSGLHSLDKREQKKWQSSIRVGNAYLNRGITGAIVQRQPFGGCKASNFGRGAKAGGPNYLTQLMIAEETNLPRGEEELPEALAQFGEILKEVMEPEEITLWRVSCSSYLRVWQDHFSKQHDPNLLLGQDNFFGYVPRKKVALRLQEGDVLKDLVRVISATFICGTPLVISGDIKELEKIPGGKFRTQFSHVTFVKQDEQTFCKSIDEENFFHIRLLTPPSKTLAQGVAPSAASLMRQPVLSQGRIELLHYVREFSMSIDYHRYGQLGERVAEARRRLSPTIVESN